MNSDPGGWVDEVLRRELTLVMQAHLQVQRGPALGGGWVASV